MKRLSYMHDYATPEGTVIHVHPVVHSPRLLQSLKRFDSVKKTTSAAPLSARKQTPYVSFSQNRVKIERGGGLYRENRENVQPSVKPTSKAQLHSLSTTKPSRRYAMHSLVPRPSQFQRAILKSWNGSGYKAMPCILTCTTCNN